MGDNQLESGRYAIEAEKATFSVIATPARALIGEKRNMILNNFLRSLQRENVYFGLIDKDAYFKQYNLYLQTLLNRENTVARFAVLSDAHDVVLGWSLIEGDCLHYVFVKGSSRNKGIGTALVPIQVKAFTHITKPGMSLWNNKAPDAAFNPFL